MRFLHLLPLGFCSSLSAAVLYTNPGPITVDETGGGSNLAGMSLSKSNTDTGTLYFKFTVVSPASNFLGENYFAGFNFYEGGSERLGVGNSWNAWAYSAYNTSSGDVDLNSATPESGQTYQFVRSTDTTLFVIRIDFQNGANDNVTVWLNPNLALEESAQNSALKTTFTANATFNEIRLREGGVGNGWTFSNIAIAENGTDSGFFAAPIPEPSSITLAGLVGLAVLRRRRN